MFEPFYRFGTWSDRSHWSAGAVAVILAEEPPLATEAAIHQCLGFTDLLENEEFIR
jgi:hypothetical protein